MRRTLWNLVPLAGAVGIVLIGGTLEATPTISIDSPPPGDLYDLTPTITISYSSDNPAIPLNLNSLLITVNGLDWTGKFTQTATQATYAVTEQDELIAGDLTITASISDTAQPPVQASASRSYAVFPTLEAISPTIGREGTVLTLVVQGLDPDPTKNKAVFRGAFAPEVEIAFETVDLVLDHGTVRIADYAATGPVFAQVNGRRSSQSFPVTVLSEFPTCSAYWRTEDILSMSDGGMLVNYDTYTPTDPNCPAIPPGFRDPVVVRMRPDGGIDMVGTSWSSVPPFPTKHQNLIAMALDKTGLDPVRVYEEFTTPGVPFTPFVIYKTIKSHFGTGLHPWDADFDGDGNLYLIVSTTKDDHAANRIIRLLRIPAAALATGGTVVPEVVADNLQTECGARARLRVSCDGSAYVALRGCFDAPSPGQSVFYGGALLKIQDGQVVANTPVTDGQLNDLALTCEGGEVYGTKMKDVWFLPGDNEVWRSVGGGPLERIVALPNSVANEKLTVSPAGHIYISYYVPAERAILKVPYQVPACGSLNGQPFCALSPLNILPTTTRWKPQWSDGAISVDFEGPQDLQAAAMPLEITAPSGATLTGQSVTFVVINNQTNPAKYLISWSGPWVDATGQRLEPGDYQLVVHTIQSNGIPLSSTPGAANSTVSLVEVTSLSLADIPDTPPCPVLKPNPVEGDPSLAAFPEAATAGGPRCDQLEVRATITPAVPDPRNEGPVKVYFKSFDVDDPSAEGAPVDDPELPQDNLGTPKAGKLINAQNVEVDMDVETQVWIQVTGSSTSATTKLRLSQRQGDNYRVGASTRDDILPGITIVTGEDSDGQVVHSTVPGFVQYDKTVSKMVTAWRTIHFEFDHLDTSAVTQATFDVTGTSEQLTARRLTDHQASFIEDEEGADHPEKDDWRGADLWPKASVVGSKFEVERNRDRWLEVVDGSNMTAVAAAGDTYRLADDYEVTLSPAASLVLANAIFKGVFIVLDLESTGVPNPNVAHPFEPNMNMDDQEVGTSLKDSTSSTDYWVIQVIQAYDSQILTVVNQQHKGDNDPVTENAALGKTVGHAVSWPTIIVEQPKSAIFHETIRDMHAENIEAWTQAGTPLTIAQVADRTTAHELGHATNLGLGHKDNTLMGEAFDPTANGTVIDDQQLRLLREMLRPEAKELP